MRPVVLVHGFLNSATKFRPMAQFLNGRGFRTFALSMTPSSGTVGLDELALQVRAFVDEQLPSGEPFDLIGFSMGGLVSRYYLQRLGGMERVHRFIAISTPHHGSYWAYAVGNTACRQMRPGSAFLEELNRDMKMLEQVRLVSLWTPLDLMIIPASSSRLDAGEEVVIPVAEHPLMVTSRISLELIEKLLLEVQGNSGSTRYDVPSHQEQRRSDLR
jgi:triacylglycerol lipase